MATTPHLLYVCWGFPPARSGGVYRALATANMFAAAGWRVTVLTVGREVLGDATGTDPSLEARLDPRVRVVRTAFRWPARETDITAWSRTRVEAPGVWFRWRKWADQRGFPEPAYGPWHAELRKRATELHQQDPVDLVLATANPYVTWVAATELHQRWGVPYVLDHQDAWSLDVFTGRVRHQGDRADQIERSTSAAAAEIWVVNEPIREFYTARQPEVADRIRVVPNGWDLDPHPAAPELHSPLVFGYLGTMGPQVPLREFLAGWRLARERAVGTTHPFAGATAELHGYLGFYAAPDESLAALIDSAADVGVSYLGPVHKTDVAATYARFDSCLLILGTGRYVTSGKVYEYAATGLPIVAVHDPGNAATAVLADYPRRVACADLSPDAIAAALLAAAVEAARGESSWAAARAVGQQFRWELVLGERATALRQLVSPLAGATTAQAPLVAAADRVAPAEAGVTTARANRPTAVLVATAPIPVGFADDLQRLAGATTELWLLTEHAPPAELGHLFTRVHVVGADSSAARRARPRAWSGPLAPLLLRLDRAVDLTGRRFAPRSRSASWPSGNVLGVALDSGAVRTVWQRARRSPGTAAVLGLPAANRRLAVRP